MKRFFLAASLALASLVAQAAVVPTEQDPVAAARAVKLEEQLRCLVCQNQTIAESNAELAADLRRQVREQIAAGRTDDEIVDFMTSRYGDFVLYKPPFKATTALLWGGPLVLLAGGFLVLAGVVRKRRVATAAAPELTDEERARARRLLDGDNAKEPS